MCGVAWPATASGRAFDVLYPVGRVFHTGARAPALRGVTRSIRGAIVGRGGLCY